MSSAASWRTTVFGIAALLVAIGTLGSALIAMLDGDPTTVPDWESVFAAVSAALAGLGLMNARDDKVTSEKAGAK